jgi:hypothetical protein
MKTTIKIALAALIFTGLWSCTDDDNFMIAHPEGSFELNTPDSGTSIVLTQGLESNPALTFTWDAATYTTPTEVSYEVEIAKEGTNFEPFTPTGATSSLNKMLTVAELNDVALLCGLEGNVAGALEVRVKASIGNSEAEVMYSNVILINVTPFQAEIPQLFLVGSVQQYYGLNIWDPATAMPMRYIGNGTTKVFEGYVKVTTGDEFKFIGEQGTWDNGSYGTIGGAQDGNLEDSNGSSNLKVAEGIGEGLYYIWVDINQLKYKVVKMDWGIIGAATPSGWGAETPMIYDFANNKFTIDVTLSQDNMKFRCKNAGDFISNNEWAFQTGNSDPKVAYDNGAGDIPVSAGATTIEYRVDFNGLVTVTGI